MVQRRVGIRTARLAGACAVAAGTCLLAAVPTGADAPRTHVHPQIRVGGFPTGMSIDPSTDTIYVGNGTDDNLSLINGRTCNASSTTGCGQRIVAVTAGTDPIGSIVDAATNTVYAINQSSDSVAVINGRTCDAAHTTGCDTEPATIRVGAGPEFGALDPNTETLYVANFDANTVSVVSLRSCNATTTSGCHAAVRAVVHSGPDPFAVAVDVPTDTVYVTNDGSDTVTVIDGTRCNASAISGCATVSHEYVGEGPGGITVDETTDTVYVANQDSDSVSMFSGATCNAVNTTRCGQSAYQLKRGDGDRGIAVDELTDSIYVANTNNNTALVFSGAACNGTVHTGCVVHTIHVGASPRRVVVDASTDTIYVTNADSDTVSMIDGRTCSGAVTSGC